MSLKSLLAVGDSFSGTRMAPYEVKIKRSIPVFGNGAEGNKGEGLVTSSPTEAGVPAPQEEMDFEKQREARVKIAPERRRIEQELPERRRLLDRRWREPAKRLKQAEMTLDQVRVVRNDLSDADLELAPRRAARSVEGDLNPFAPRPIAAIGRPTHEKLGMGTRVARWFRFLKRAKS